MIPSRAIRLLSAFLVLLSTIGCDQTTKHFARTELSQSGYTTFAGGLVQLILSENPGAFLSLGGTLPESLRRGLLTVGVLALLMSRWAEKYYRVLRMAWYWIPMVFIAYLIYAAKDPNSYYYAGFNLVLLTVGVVLPWTYREILATSMLIIGAYIAISLRSGWGINPILANNLFFLGCTALIVVTGSFFHSRLRFREFALRFELERNRKLIEENNRKLVELDQVKSRFFANISHDIDDGIERVSKIFAYLKQEPYRSPYQSKNIGFRLHECIDHVAILSESLKVRLDFAEVSKMASLSLLLLELVGSIVDLFYAGCLLYLCEQCWVLETSLEFALRFFKSLLNSVVINHDHGSRKLRRRKSIMSTLTSMQLPTARKAEFRLNPMFTLPQYGGLNRG